MTPLVALLAISTVVTGVLAFGLAWLTTRKRIAGAYNRERLLPNEIDSRLRAMRKMQTIIWLLVVILLVAVGVVLHWLYAQDIMLDGGLWYDLLYVPLVLLGLPYVIGHPLIYLTFAACLLLASWWGVRLGVKWAAHSFILTRRLPAVA